MSEPPRKRLVRAPTGGSAEGRATPARLKTAKMRTASSQAWLERQVNDPFSAAARAAGYRSRAAYKLREIDDRVGLIRPGARVIDLGCAPGSWLQVALQRGAGAVAGVDLLPTLPIAGATTIEADFTDPGIGERLVDLVGGAPDLVMSDLAPNTVGHRRTDHLRIIRLIEAAADFACAELRPGSSSSQGLPGAERRRANSSAC